MRSIDEPPNAAAILESMRSIGYSFGSAVADLIDNSIAARARIVQIAVRSAPSYVAVLDDGEGMSESILAQSMRLGSTNPNEPRGSEDHGRFGLGLKTASLSQCRRLTVISKREGALAAARWDLDVVEATNSWTLLLLEEQDLPKLPLFEELASQNSGTIVLWEHFDRLGNASAEAEIAEALTDAAVETSEHLSLVYHRLMDRSLERSLSISINGTALQPADPFLLTNRYTHIVGKQTAIVDGSAISAIAYVLPRDDEITQKELSSAGGASRMRDLQGFFVYRNLRLISYGTWFKLANRDELTRLARIQIDIDNSADTAWRLDIKKSSLQPTLAIRRFLATMVTCVTEASARRYRRLVSTAQQKENAVLWLRIFKDGALFFKLNRHHPLIVNAVTNLSSSENRSVEALLDAIELGIPLRQLYFDQLANQNVSVDTEELEAKLRRILAVILDESRARSSIIVREMVADLEPFRSYPDLTAKLCKELTC